MDTLGLVAGHFIEDVQPSWYRDYLVGSYNEAFGVPEPLFQKVFSHYQGNDFEYRRLFLPMTMDGKVYDLLLVATWRMKVLRDYMRRAERTFD